MANLKLCKAHGAPQRARRPLHCIPLLAQCLPRTRILPQHACLTVCFLLLLPLRRLAFFPGTHRARRSYDIS